MVSPRRIVHVSMLGFALLLPFLTWQQAAGAAVLALLFNRFILPQLNIDLRNTAALLVSYDDDVRRRLRAPAWHDRCAHDPALPNCRGRRNCDSNV